MADAAHPEGKVYTFSYQLTGESSIFQEYPEVKSLYLSHIFNTNFLILDFVNITR